MPAVYSYAKSLTELLANRVGDQPDRPAVYTGISEMNAGKLLQPLSYSQVQKAVHRLAWHYSALGLMPETDPGSLPPIRIVAVLTSSAIDESLLEIALARLGLTALLLSVNNSVSAVAHLTKITNASYLIYGIKYVQEANEVQAILHDQGYKLDLVEDRRFPLWGPGGVDEMPVKPYPARLTPEQEKDRPAVILHSSGSTGFPKPVYITHYGLIANVALNQNKPGFSTLPVYHGYGHFAVFRCWYSGQPITLFPPHLPLTSANICSVLAASPPVRQCFAVPYVIKLLSETQEGVEALASFDIVGYAGAALPDDLGNRLVMAGVNLLSIYGTTETGSLLNSNREYSSDKAWNWVRPFGLSMEYVFMEPRGDNTFEAIVKDGYPPKIETNRPDGSYATKDLFLRHPQHNWYKYVGRLDDTLVQTLGEKTNPVPIELCIRGNSPYVTEAIVFGAGRPQTGCLILPSELGKDLSPAELMEKVWPVIEQANAEAPTHSRLLPEMVEFLPYGTHIPVATKMSILRPACYVKFKDLIHEIYRRFEQGSEVEKVTLARPELEDLIYHTIVKTLGSSKSAKLNKTVDLFAFGVDSLQGTRIRNTLQQSLELHGETLGQNVVYEHPSVEKLASYILSLQSGSDGDKSSDHQQEAMLAMLDKWSAKFESHIPTSSEASTSDPSHVVVLTGATGSLGAHILSQLAASPAVRKVICLSRASSHVDSLKRVKESLDLRKLTIDDEGKIESYAANANAEFLGLSEHEYDIIRNEATIVIHNAWPVNFVLSIESYDEHVGGALNLINLCLKSPQAHPATFYFSSSISCRQGASDATCTEDFSPSPNTAAGTGYARSKWVVEKLCQRAAEQTRVKVGVLRIGQMVGDSISGVWNETEAWPLMFKGSSTVGALPRVDEHPSWLPVDYAGRAISELVLRQHSPKSVVYHIVNPNINASWDDILADLKEVGLKFEPVDRTEWLKRLEASDKDPQRNPIIKLLPFFRNRYNNAGRKPMVFLTDETAKAAPSIRASPSISRDLVRKWVDHWREVGFLA